MTPDEINSLAFRAILGITVILGAIFFTVRASERSSAPVLVAGQTAQTGAVLTDVPEDSPISAPTGLDATTSTRPAVTSPLPTTAVPAPTTSTTVSTTTLAATTTSTVRPTTTTTARPTTTTTVRPTTTTTTVPPITTTTVPPTTTTTVPPTTTTTTTVPPTTTTTIPPTTTTTTTTTIPPTTTTTTTTTIPPTTTTTIPLPSLLVHKFDGHDHGDVGEWEAHIKIEIRDENDDRAGFASVTVAWGGSQPSSQLLASDKDGKIDTRLGPFSDPTLTLRITNVQLAGFVYRPALNEVSATLIVAGPN